MRQQKQHQETKNTINTFPKFQLSPGSFQKKEKKHDKIEHIQSTEITGGKERGGRKLVLFIVAIFTTVKIWKQPQLNRRMKG